MHYPGFLSSFSLSAGLNLDVYLQKAFSWLLTQSSFFPVSLSWLPSWLVSSPEVILLMWHLPRMYSLFQEGLESLWHIHTQVSSWQHNEASHILVWCVELVGMRDGRMLEVWVLRVDAVMAVGGACQGWRRRQVLLVLEKPFDVFKISVFHL